MKGRLLRPSHMSKEAYASYLLTSAYSKKQLTASWIEQKDYEVGLVQS